MPPDAEKPQLAEYISVFLFFRGHGDMTPARLSVAGKPENIPLDKDVLVVARAKSSCEASWLVFKAFFRTLEESVRRP